MASKRIAERSVLIAAVMLVADAGIGSAEAQSMPCYDIALGPCR
jgi:hypothetical protein